MDRATKAIKRGSIRLKSYSEINLIISDLNEMRSCGKSSVKAYQTFIEDLIKWAHREMDDNVKNMFSLLSELTQLWNEFHHEFFENLKKFRQQFELILESEQAIDKARNNVGRCQQTETQLNKDLEKIRTRGDNGRASEANRLQAEVGKVEEKLKEAKRASELAKIEVSQKESENKIVKLIPGQILKKLTDSNLTLAHKSIVIMRAQKVLCSELPNDEAHTSTETRFIKECKIKSAIAKAKIAVQTTSCQSEANAPTEYDPPPPYSPFFGSSHPHHFHRNSFSGPGPSTSNSISSTGEAYLPPESWWFPPNPGRRRAPRADCAQIIPEMQLVANMQNSRIS